MSARYLLKTVSAAVTSAAVTFAALGITICGTINHAAAQVNTPTPTPGPKKVWTAAEMVREHRIELKRAIKQPKPARPRFCQGGRFKPCVCSRDVTLDMQYRPAVRECNGNAAVMLYGKYRSSFSVVLRDSENRDRWPRFGFNGCSSALANSDAPPAYCSMFKTQDTVAVATGTANQGRLHCFGAPGYSSFMSRVVRVTVKLADIPNSNKDPLVRWCLKGPTEPLN